MKVLLYSRFGQYPQEIESAIKRFGFEIVSKNPDLVIAYGGDGTLLGAERDYPNLPKLPLRNSNVGFHCLDLSVDQALNLLLQKKLILTKFSKLEAIYKNQKLLALNEFTFRNVLPTTALRLTLLINNQPQNLIGDGLVISTPFGSTGYYHSITKKSFARGIGIAFNNMYNVDQKLQLLPKDSIISITIDRGPAHFTADNNPKILTLNSQESVIIKTASLPAQIYTLP